MVYTSLLLMTCTTSSNNFFSRIASLPIRCVTCLFVCFLQVSWARLIGCVKLKNGVKVKYDHLWETVNLCEGCFASVRRNVVFPTETVWLTLTNIIVKRGFFLTSQLLLFCESVKICCYCNFNLIVFNLWLYDLCTCLKTVYSLWIETDNFEVSKPCSQKYLLIYWKKKKETNFKRLLP